MSIEILFGKEGALAAKGIVVVVDVFRAASCASVALARGAEKILPVKTTEEAFDLKKMYPDTIIMGEEGGVMVEGFDLGNSPSDLEQYDVKNKVVIQRTSAGTKGLVLASQRLGQEVSKVYFGAFTTISALAKLLLNNRYEKISIVAMDGPDTEDSYYADCLKSLLEGKVIDRNTIIKYLQIHKKSAHFFDKTRLSHPEEDFYICTDVDRYNFVVELNYERGKMILQRVNN